MTPPLPINSPSPPDIDIFTLFYSSYVIVMVDCGTAPLVEWPPFKTHSLFTNYMHWFSKNIFATRCCSHMRPIAPAKLQNSGSRNYREIYRKPWHIINEPSVAILFYNFSLFRLRHCDERPWSCSTCQMTTPPSHPQTPFQHLRLIFLPILFLSRLRHCDERPWSCSTCQMTFKTRDIMKK